MAILTAVAAPPPVGDIAEVRSREGEVDKSNNVTFGVNCGPDPCFHPASRPFAPNHGVPLTRLCDFMDKMSNFFPLLIEKV